MSFCLINNYDTQTKNINPTHTYFVRNKCAEIYIRHRFLHLFRQPRKPHLVIPLKNSIRHTTLSRNWRRIQRLSLWQSPTHSWRILHPTFRLYMARHTPQPHYLLPLPPTWFQSLFWFHPMAKHKNSSSRLPIQRLAIIFLA